MHEYVFWHITWQIFDQEKVLHDPDSKDFYIIERGPSREVTFDGIYPSKEHTLWWRLTFWYKVDKSPQSMINNYLIKQRTNNQANKLDFNTCDILIYHICQVVQLLSATHVMWSPLLEHPDHLLQYLRGSALGLTSQTNTWWTAPTLLFVWPAPSPCSIGKV